MSSKTELEKIESLREAFKSYMLEAGDALAAGPASAPMPAAPAAPAAPPQQTPAPEQTLDPLSQGGSQPPPVEYTIQQFVDSMNKIRGGRSFDDQDVYQQVNALFVGLDPASRESLKNVVEQLEAIVTPIQPGQQEQPTDGSLPSVTDTQTYNANINQQAPQQAPVSVPGEAPPA